MTDPQIARRTPLSNDPVGSLVGEFMEEKRREREDEKARQAPRKKNPFVLPLLVAICLAVWMAPSLMPPVGATLSQETVEQGARLNLYLASLRVREYLAKHQRLPETLVEAGVDSTGLVYSKGDGTAFELSTRVHGARMVYRSTIPDSVFLGSAHVRGIS